MSNSPILDLPYLQAAQAQKHVTVNEALTVLDAACQISLLSATTTIPPAIAGDGDCFGIPTGATNEWAGQVGDIALYSNGGWVYLTPKRGWRAEITDIAASAVFDGSAWIIGGTVISPNGAATIHEITETDHTITSGSTNAVSGAISSHSVVIGVTGRVTGTISGTLTDWQLGVPGFDNRYGSGLGMSLGSWVRGITASPQTYYADTDLLLTAVGGDFAAGTIRLAVHSMRLSIPST